MTPRTPDQLAADGRESRRRLERSLANRYRRRDLPYYLSATARDQNYPFMGILPEFEFAGLEFTRKVVRELGHRLHRLVRGRAACEPWATSQEPIRLWSLRAALFGEAMIYARQTAAQRSARSQLNTLVAIGEAMFPDEAA